MVSIEIFFFWLAFGFCAGVIRDSFFEWILHRYVMHRRVSFFSYPFERHALMHHHIFKANETYHLQREADRHTVPMAWWNGPVLILLAQIPFAAATWLTGSLALLCGSFLSSCCYYAAYEYLHWCMHIPRARNVERSGLFFRLNGHHLLHHRYPHKNLNVVLPFADWCMGTLLRRSKVGFAQARGPSVPDVQPNVAVGAK
jgi:hypothetical protein